MTETEGKWFWEDDTEHCGATMMFPGCGCTFVGVCDRPKRHEGLHSGEIRAGVGNSLIREYWNDRDADKANRHHCREMVRAFGGDELPYEDGI